MATCNFGQVTAWAALWLILSGSAGCTADISDIFNKDKSPKIANLVYIPQRAHVDKGKTTTIIGTFDIVYESGETALVNTVAYDVEGRKVYSGSISLSGTALKTSDTLGFGFDMDTAKQGDYTFQVSIMDSKGRQSNKLDGVYSVTAFY